MKYSEFYKAEAKARKAKDWRVDQDHNGMPVLRYFVGGKRTSVYVERDRITDENSFSHEKRKELEEAYQAWLNQKF